MVLSTPFHTLLTLHRSHLFLPTPSARSFSALTFLLSKRKIPAEVTTVPGGLCLVPETFSGGAMIPRHGLVGRVNCHFDSSAVSGKSKLQK